MVRAQGMVGAIIFKIPRNCITRCEINLAKITHALTSNHAPSIPKPFAFLKPLVCPNLALSVSQPCPNCTCSNYAPKMPQEFHSCAATVPQPYPNNVSLDCQIARELFSGEKGAAQSYSTNLN